MPTCLQILNSSIGRRVDVLDLISLCPAHSHTPSMAPFVNGPRVDLPCYLANIPVTFMLHRIHPIIYPTGCEILWLEHTYDWGWFFRWLIYWDETDFEWFAIDLRLFKLVISNSWAVRWFFLGSFQGEFVQKMATSSILGTSLVSLRCVYLWCPWNHSYRTFFSFFPGPLKSWGSIQDVTEEHHNELEDTHISYW